MIVRDDRTKLQYHLCLFLNLKINSFTLEDNFFNSHDMLVNEIIAEIEWHLREGEPHICDTEILRSLIIRCIKVLNTDFEFPNNYKPIIPTGNNFIYRFFRILWDMILNNFCAVSKLGDNPFWPLSSQDDCDRLEELVRCPCPGDLGRVQNLEPGVEK
ncbi:MAG: hypothetical protein LBH00_06595 [Planctomycetaceae bacterium]|nr:hypothetical protein [Planctomycetaceae bacterium]